MGPNPHDERPARWQHDSGRASIRGLQRALVVALLMTGSRAQTRVAIEGIHLPAVDRLLAADVGGRTGRAAAETALGRLRLGAVDDALRELENAIARLDAPDRTAADAAWSAVGCYWWLRASRDPTPIVRFVPTLATAVDDAAAAAATRADFADEGMLVHALLCLDAIEARIGDPGRRPSRRGADAITRWLRFERETWQPGLGRFVPRCATEAPPVNLLDDPSVLVPAAAGMLIASGDRMVRHLRATVDAATARGGALEAADTGTAALVLAAATQLGDAAARSAAWQALERAEATAADAATMAARALDAALFALSGVRLATGVAVDEDWLRVRPWLPPGTNAASLGGLLAEGARFDLAIRRQRGSRANRAADEPELPDDAPALVVRLTLAATAPRALRIVVQGHMLQFVTTLEPGAAFERSLPDPELR